MNKKSLNGGASQDISKAFDSAPRGLKAIAVGRSDLPDEFGDMFATMDEANQTIVHTPYGTSEEVLVPVPSPRARCVVGPFWDRTGPPTEAELRVQMRH